MNEKNKELIREVSNSEFPLDAFANDIEHLRFEQPGNPALEAYDFDYMEEDLIKIAKAFKSLQEKAEKASSYKPPELKEDGKLAWENNMPLSEFVGTSYIGTEFSIHDDKNCKRLFVYDNSKSYVNFLNDFPYAHCKVTYWEIIDKGSIKVCIDCEERIDK